MQKRRRKTGDTLLKLETVLDELADEGLQWGDILALVYSYLMVHRPKDREEYTDGGHPEFYYGPKKDTK